MVGENRNDPGYQPEGQGTYGFHADGDRCSPTLPVSALSWSAGSFIVGCLVAAASGYGWLGILVTGWLTFSAIAIALIVRSAHADYCARKTWWIERDQ